MASELAGTTPRRLLFATDLSARCDRALDRAAMLATEWSARLSVIHALEPSVYSATRDPRPAPSWRQQPNIKQAIAVKQIHQELGQLDVAFDLILEEGEPADVILRAGEQHGGDLIITGIARGETFGRFIFGGTVDLLVRNAAIPLLVVKNRARTPYKSIVIATDFSEASRKAIEETAKMLPTAKLTLLHCYETTLSAVSRSGTTLDGGRQIASGQYDDFIKSDPATASRISMMPIFMERGSLENAIHAYAADKALDLLVIASQGKNILTRVLVGSTAEIAMATAPSDVLVINPR